MTIESKTTRIALGTDHAGFAYKEAINSFLLEKGYQTKDFGTFSEESVDYPNSFDLRLKPWPKACAMLE